MTQTQNVSTLPAPVPQLPPFKYTTQLKTISRCPPPKLQTTLTVAFRFAFQDLEDKRNFLPIALINPSRATPAGAPISECCEAFSLSMYTTLETLEKKVKSAKAAAPQLLKRLGNHYAELQLTPLGGGHTTPNKSGHFEFFERAASSESTP